MGKVCKVHLAQNLPATLIVDEVMPTEHQETDLVQAAALYRVVEMRMAHIQDPACTAL